MSRAIVLLAVAAIASLVSAGCYKAPEEAIKLEGDLLTVSNISNDEWTHVEIWISRRGWRSSSARFGTRPGASTLW